MTTTLEAPAETEKRVATQLPEPSGYKLLIALPDVSDTTDSGIYKPHSVRQLEELSTVVGFVLKIGPDAYRDESRFPSGPYCSEGDWVIFRAFSGTRIKIHDKEFRLINDDTVEAVVEDPQGITRA